MKVIWKTWDVFYVYKWSSYYLDFFSANMINACLVVNVICAWLTANVTCKEVRIRMSPWKAEW